MSAEISVTDLSEAIRTCESGVLLLDIPSPTKGTSTTPYSDISNLFDHLAENKDVCTRLNAAYSKNLVYKASHDEGNGGPRVDEKRVLDLSPERLASIADADPALLNELKESHALGSLIDFMENIKKGVTMKLLSALEKATGVTSPAASAEEYRFNYRFVDYYARSTECEAPRCGEHKDFGPMTLIFQSSTEGLEVQVEGEWRDIPPSASGNAVQAVLLFGLCTAWRSNDRIKAANHRVVNSTPVNMQTVARRCSAVLFVGLGSNATLAPVVLPGEKACYKTASVGDIHPIVARKWKVREGTVTEAQIKAEEEEAKSYPTQEALIAHLYKTECAH